MQSFRVSEFRRGKASELQRDIVKTLAYSDIFGYSLKEEEIWRWLIVNKFKVQSSKFKVGETLEELVAKEIIGRKGNFYFFRSREGILTTRKKRKEYSTEKFEIAKKTAEKLKLFSWIKMIGVTGALAMNNADKDDDIDLIIITSVNRLWLTRLLIFLLCPILGIERRKPKDKKVKNKICFNLFLDEDHLKISPENLFLAHEICQVKPLVNKDEIYEKFLWENRWVKKFLPNATKISSKFKIQSSKLQCKIQNCLSIIFGFLNKVVYKFQYLYMKPKITREKISLHQAFFHPRDLSKTIEGKLNLYFKNA